MLAASHNSQQGRRCYFTTKRRFLSGFLRIFRPDKAKERNGRFTGKSLGVAAQRPVNMVREVL
jgi:hypothetical protein